MSRLSIEVTGEQHQQIKALAAIKGQSIKDYILEKVFTQDNEEQQAWDQLKALLNARLDDVRRRGTSPHTVKDITEKALKSLD